MPPEPSGGFFHIQEQQENTHMGRKATVKLPWYSLPENLNVLREWALRLVPGNYIKIDFVSSIATGRFIRYKATSWIEVNPCPYYEASDGAATPFFKTRKGQWNACRAILAHE